MEYKFCNVLHKIPILEVITDGVAQLLEARKLLMAAFHSILGHTH